MTDRITLTGIAVEACHGVLPQEKATPQPFRADIVLEVDLAAAGGSDALTDTVSYAEVAQETEAILTGEPVDLIETLAERIAAAALRHAPVEAVEVTIHKPQAPAGVPFSDPVLAGPAVHVRRERDRPVVIALGANLGDRVAVLRSAVRLLADVPGLTPTRVSPLVETDPVGGPEQPDYLNAVVVARTRLAPLTLLAHCQRIEAWHGRTREIRWGARTLDVDLIQLGDPRDDSDVRSDRPELELPHPRAHERAFVLRPWLAAQPGAVLRVGGDVVPVEQLLEVLGDQGVRPGPAVELW